MKYFSLPLPTAFLLAIFVLSCFVGCNGQPITIPVLPISTTDSATEHVAEVERDADEKNLEAQTEVEEALNGAVSQLAAACSPINIPSNPLIAQISAGEWSEGSTSAPITLIEYADFQ